MTTHLAKYHFWLGLSGIIVFILTGQYMDHFHNHLEGMADGPRLLYRSAHIYLLLTSLCNVFYSHANSQNVIHANWLNWVISLTLLCAPVFMTLEFFYGAHSINEERTFLRIGVYSLFASAVLLVAARLREQFKNNTRRP